MEAVLVIADGILHIGGALLVLLALGLVVVLLSTVWKIRRLTNKIEKAYHQSMLLASVPFKLLTQWLGDSDTSRRK